MDKKIKNALDDINLIKEVVNKTQQNFTTAPHFLISVGIVNITYIILEQLGYYFRNVYGYVSNIYHVLGSVLSVFQLVGYVILFLFLNVKKRHSDNMDKKIFEMWGIIFIGSEVLFWIYKIFLPVGSSQTIGILYRFSELVLMLPVLIGSVATGIFLKDRFLCVVTSIFSCIYLILFVGMKEIPYGTIAGVGTRLPLSSILMRLFLTIGLLAIGIYLKKWRRIIHGNKCNTRSLSN